MNAHTLTHQIAAPLEVIPQELGHKAVTLATAIKVLEITDQTTFDVGNKLLIDSHQALKDLEAARTRLKKPITELGREIDRVVASVADPLDVAKRSMQGKVANWQRIKFEEAAKANREAQAKAKQEAEAAEQERARLQAIADEEHAKQVRAAKAKALEEASELEAILGKPVEAVPVVVAPAPVILAAPVTTVVPAVVAPAATAVQRRTVQRVEFIDRMLVPIHVAGELVRPIDEPAIKRLLLAGVVVPGARLVDAEVLAMSRATVTA